VLRELQTPAVAPFWPDRDRIFRSGLCHRSLSVSSLAYGSSIHRQQTVAHFGYSPHHCGRTGAHLWTAGGDDHVGDVSTNRGNGIDPLRKSERHRRGNRISGNRAPDMKVRVAEKTLEGGTAYSRTGFRNRAALSDWGAFLRDPNGRWLCILIAAGGFLRLYGLDFQSLWSDEGFQYYIATQNSIGKLFQQALSFHPPLSFIVNHLFLRLGYTDFLLRLPSALFGIASLPVLYVLGRELTSKKAAVFAVFVLAFSPFHIWYSQEARMYSQLLFLSLLSSVLLLQALRRGEMSWWIYYA